MLEQPWLSLSQSRMRSDSVKNVSAYAAQNHAPSLADARLEFFIRTNETVPQVASQQTSTESYILNTNTKKFHRPSCSSVKQMKESNKKSSSESSDALIAAGYDPCKKCNP